MPFSFQLTVLALLVSKVVEALSCASGDTVLTFGAIGVLQCEYPTRDGEVLAIRGIACVNRVC